MSSGRQELCLEEKTNLIPEKEYIPAVPSGDLRK